ncbi:MAG: glycosyltransferase family 4 protein [Ferruginibacter sp.]
MNSQQLNVVYLANGYPTKDNPSHGIFNQRAANAIKDHVNLTVIQYRIYKPGRKFAEHIKEAGFTRIILSVPYSPVWESKLYYFNNRMFYFFTLFFARSVLKNADIIHASDGNLGIFTSWIKKKHAFKLLVQFIGGDLNQDLVQFYKKNWMQNWKSRLDAVSFNSMSMQERFKELFGAHPVSKVIYRGVDITKFSSAGNGTGKLIFYFLGGLPNYSTFEHGRNTKGGLNLMKAWTRLDEEIKGDNIQLLFAGPDSDIAMVKEWRLTLQEPGRVDILGKIDPVGLAGFHRKGNICLVPSLEEGLPNVAMEAASTGNLVIANGVGGVPEIISNYVTGIICETNDADGLYEKMKWVIQHPEQVEVIRDNAAKHMQANFSSRDFGKKYFEFYTEMTSF